jgi:hypothetical protein
MKCDYSGHSCNCQGFKAGKTKNLCECGHYKKQHNSEQDKNNPRPDCKKFSIVFGEYVEAIYSDELIDVLSELGSVSVRRASHVDPCGTLQRLIEVV